MPAKPVETPFRVLTLLISSCSVTTIFSRWSSKVDTNRWRFRELNLRVSDKHLPENGKTRGCGKHSGHRATQTRTRLLKVSVASRPLPVTVTRCCTDKGTGLQQQSWETHCVTCTVFGRLDRWRHTSQTIAVGLAHTDCDGLLNLRDFTPNFSSNLTYVFRWKP